MPDALLADHLRTCPQCEHYLQINKRVIAALAEFSFDVDPSLQTRVVQAVCLRARQCQTENLNRRRLAQVCGFALILVLLGSVLDIAAGRLVEPLFSAQHLHLQQNIVSFWILPSCFVLLLFPLLPLLTRQRGPA